MIMHPYRPELVGSDLNDYKDPKGVERIVEFELTSEEKASLNESVDAVQEQMAATGL